MSLESLIKTKISNMNQIIIKTKGMTEKHSSLASLRHMSQTGILWPRSGSSIRIGQFDAAIC
jgi:hypothetical protein